MTTTFNAFRDSSGNAAYAPYFNITTKYAAKLLLGVEQTFTLPLDADAYTVIFSYSQGSTVLVGWGSTALTIPTGAFALTTGEFDPSARTIPKGTTLRFITQDASALVGITLYASNG